MRAQVVALALATAMVVACHEPEREPPPVPPHPTDPANAEFTSRAGSVTGPKLASALEDIDASILSDGSSREAAPPGLPDEAGVPMRAELARNHEIPSPSLPLPTSPAWASVPSSAGEAPR